MLPPSPGTTNGVEVFSARREGLRYLVDDCASTGAFAIIDQKSPFLVFLVIFTQSVNFQMLIKCIHHRLHCISWFSQGLPQGIASLATIGGHLEDLEHVFPEPLVSADESFSAKS